MVCLCLVFVWFCTIAALLITLLAGFVVRLMCFVGLLDWFGLL